MDLLARVGKLVTLYCFPCVLLRLLLIFDVEWALAAASAAVGLCCLLACGALRLCLVMSEFSRQLTAR